MAEAKKVFTTEELKEHKSRKTLWMAIHGKVYDITEFMDEHPGGPEVLLDSAGQDATTDFEDVGHSDEAREMLAKYLIGDYSETETAKKAIPKAASAAQTSSKAASTGGFPAWLIPVALIALAIGVRYYFVHYKFTPSCRHLERTGSRRHI
eukprot:EC123026.1.p1 GENE.EC123026.1~~EC123026.1.p1  ORF type:complete len:151 (+),score=19.46 EC123026.1:161-613(+)